MMYELPASAATTMRTAAATAVEAASTAHAATVESTTRAATAEAATLCRAAIAAAVAATVSSAVAAAIANTVTTAIATVAISAAEAISTTEAVAIAAEPGTGTNEDAFIEVGRPIVPIRSAGIWSVTVVAVGADGRRVAVASDANSNSYLGMSGMRKRCRDKEDAK
jgi:hypothetical protein